MNRTITILYITLNTLLFPQTIEGSWEIQKLYKNDTLITDVNYMIYQLNEDNGLEIYARVPIDNPKLILAESGIYKTDDTHIKIIYEDGTTYKGNYSVSDSLLTITYKYQTTTSTLIFKKLPKPPDI